MVRGEMVDLQAREDRHAITTGSGVDQGRSGTVVTESVARSATDTGERMGRMVKTGRFRSRGQNRKKMGGRHPPKQNNRVAR